MKATAVPHQPDAVLLTGLDVYVSADGARLTVCYDPAQDAEGEPDEAQHNCDAMGCGSLSHVLVHAAVPEWMRDALLMEIRHALEQRPDVGEEPTP